jgi:ubiquinone/menaquinone biosynthesis C-methylase UbiE
VCRRLLRFEAGSAADPVQIPALLARAYDGAVIDHDRIAEVYEGTVGTLEFQQVSRRRIHWMCAQVAGPDVLDVGCSQGIASILLAREGHRVVGIDREHEAIRAARERLDQEEAPVRERVEFKVGEGRAVGFPDDSFDAVLLGEVLEHQLDPGKLLDEARRVLRPGGRIVLTTPYGIHPYPDHKEPLHLSALLERLSAKLSIAEIALVDRYAGVVAERSKDRAPRVWRRALRVAEGRLADQDETVEKLRALVGELREGTRALERSLQEEDLTMRATEIQRDAAQQRQADLELRLADAEERATAATAQKDSALENVQQIRERLHAAELEHQAKELARQAADLEHQQALAEATRRADDLAAEVERHRHTIGVLTSEGAELRTSLSAVETALQREQETRRSVEGRLAAVTDSRAALEQELGEIKGRLGYRIGRFLRRPFARRATPPG